MINQKESKLIRIYIVTNKFGRILGSCSSYKIAENYKKFLVKNGLEYDEWVSIQESILRYRN